VKNVSSMRDLKGMSVVAQVLATKPNLWLIAILQAFHLARPGWWRSWPPLPVPSDGLWRLRILTAYGGDGSNPPQGDDVVAYLEWCRQARSWRSR